MKKTISVWVAVGAALIAIIIRTYQLANSIDFSTGFFKADSGFFKYILYILFGVTAVAAILACIFDKKGNKTLFTKTADDFTPRQTLAMGIAVLLGAIASIVEAVLGFSGKITLGLIGAALVGIIYLVIAFLLLSNKRIKKTSGYLMAFLAISYTVKAAGLFISDTVVTRVSDELLLLLAYIAAVFFFLACGRFYSRNEARFTRQKFVFFTIALAVLSGCATLSKLVIYVLRSDIASQMDAVSIAEIGSFIVSITTIIVLSSKKQDKTAEDLQSASESAKTE